MKKQLNLKQMKETYANYGDSQEVMDRIWDAFHTMYCLEFISRDTWYSFYDQCRGWVYDADKNAVIDAYDNTIIHAFSYVQSMLEWQGLPDSVSAGMIENALQQYGGVKFTL